MALVCAGGRTGVTDGSSLFCYLLTRRRWFQVVGRRRASVAQQLTIPWHRHVFVLLSLSFSYLSFLFFFGTSPFAVSFFLCPSPSGFFSPVIVNKLQNIENRRPGAKTPSAPPPPPPRLRYLTCRVWRLRDPALLHGGTTHVSPPLPFPSLVGCSGLQGCGGRPLLWHRVEACAVSCCLSYLDGPSLSVPSQMGVARLPFSTSGRSALRHRICAYCEALRRYGEAGYSEGSPL